MKKHSDGFRRESVVSRNIHICIRHILNLCKNMNIVAILTSIMKTQTPQRYVITYTVTRVLRFPTVHTHLLIWMVHVARVKESAFYASSMAYNTTIFVFHLFTIQNITNCMHRSIAKMCWKVKIRQDDRNLQRILWWRYDGEPIRTYELSTVTCGTASATYLATRCLQQLAE